MKIAVILPCYKSKEHALGVIERIGEEVSIIIAVDDNCPVNTGKFVEENCKDKRLKVIYNEVNKGVGGAVMHGYMYGLKNTQADIFVKIDSDGQMDPALVPRLVKPIVEKIADYTKGNRFFRPSYLRAMPKMRLFGNACLSFLTKLSSGYWTMMDPTNGFTAIHRTALSQLELSQISERYFFESDILYHLNLVRAVTLDMPMMAVYGDEESGLKIREIIGQFLTSNLKNTLKRFFYDYGLRNFSIGSSYLLFAIIFILFGVIFGLSNWVESMRSGQAATSGTVMIAGLPIIIGIQFLNSFIIYDVANVPRVPLQTLLTD